MAWRSSRSTTAAASRSGPRRSATSCSSATTERAARRGLRATGDSGTFIIVMEAQPPDRRGRIRILLICCMSLFIVGLDITVVNIALPSIGRDLHADISGLQWTVDAYAVVMASLLMFSGSMADRLGRKRTFVAGLAVFSVASLLCSLAPSAGMLIAFRALQAV